MNKATVSLSLESVLKFVLVIVFLLVAIMLIWLMYTGALGNINILDVNTFWKNVFGGES